MLQYLIFPMINFLLLFAFLITIIVLFNKQKNRIETFEKEVKTKIGSLSYSLKTCNMTNEVIK